MRQSEIRRPKAGALDIREHWKEVSHYFHMSAGAGETISNSKFKATTIASIAVPPGIVDPKIRLVRASVPNTSYNLQDGVTHTFTIVENAVPTIVNLPPGNYILSDINQAITAAYAPATAPITLTAHDITNRVACTFVSAFAVTVTWTSPSVALILGFDSTVPNAGTSPNVQYALLVPRLKPHSNYSVYCSAVGHGGLIVDGTQSAIISTFPVAGSRNEVTIYIPSTKQFVPANVAPNQPINNLIFSIMDSNLHDIDLHGQSWSLCIEITWREFDRDVVAA